MDFEPHISIDLRTQGYLQGKSAFGNTDEAVTRTYQFRPRYQVWSVCIMHIRYY